MKQLARLEELVYNLLLTFLFLFQAESKNQSSLFFPITYLQSNPYLSQLVYRMSSQPASKDTGAELDTFKKTGPEPPPAT